MYDFWNAHDNYLLCLWRGISIWTRGSNPTDYMLIKYDKFVVNVHTIIIESLVAWSH